MSAENASQMTNIGMLEMQIAQLEGIKVIFRLPSSYPVSQYPYSRASDSNSTIFTLIQNRILPLFKNCMPEVIVIDGNLGIPHGAQKLKNLRNTYS